MCHFLALGELAVQRRIGSAAAHGEIVGGGDHRAALDIGAAEDQIARREILERAILGIGAASGDLADLAKAALVDDAGDACASVELAAIMLARDFLLAAHFFGQPLALGQFFEFGFPAHLGVRSTLQKQDVFFCVIFGRMAQKSAISPAVRSRPV